MKKQKTKRNMLRRIIISFILLVSLCALFAPLTFTGPNNELTSSTVFAQGDKTTPPSDSPKFQELMNDTVNILNLAMEFLQRLIWPVLLLIGGLLKNDILFGAGMEEMMLNIWRNIRNIVNILFVLILLGIAFYNVMGGSSQEYHIKTILPKFIIALIAVNFSFLMVKVVIDGVSVVTTAIFALPSTVEQQLQKEDKSSDLAKNTNFRQEVCEGLYGKGLDYDPPSDESAICKEKYEFTDTGNIFFSRYDSNNAAIILAINLGEVAKINTVTIRGPGTAVKDLFLNSLFSTTIYIVYATAFIALLIILAIRLIVLWVTMVLSPLIVLTYVIPENLKGSLGGSSELGKKFVKNAIAPIPIALMMSIGFIMIQAWKQARFPTASLASETAGLNLLTSGLSTLQDLIAAIGMVVVIWIGVFEAAKDTYAEGIVGGLKTAVQQAGKFVVSAPFKYLPLIPVGEGKEPVSIGAVAGAIRRVPETFREKELKDQRRVLDMFGLGGGAAVEEAFNKANSGQQLRQASSNNSDIWGKQEGAQRALGKKLYEKPEWKRQFFVGISTKLKDKTGKEWTHDQIVDALKSGKLPEEIAKQIADVHKRAHPRTTTATKGEPGKPGEKPTEAADAKSYLTDKQNQVLADKKKGKVIPPEDRKTLEEAEAIVKTYEDDFITGLRTAKTEDPQAQINIINKAKSDLTAKGYKDEQVKQMLAPEINKILNGYENEKNSTKDEARKAVLEKVLDEISKDAGVQSIIGKKETK